MNSQINRRQVALPNIPQIVADAKQKVSPEIAKELQLRVLIALDAAKRGKANPPLANYLIRNVMMAIALGNTFKDKTFHSLAMKAYSALFKAAQRPTNDLDLTTSEYKSIRAAMGLYVRHIPNLAGKLLDQMADAADHHMRKMA